MKNRTLFSVLVSGLVFTSLLTPTYARTYGSAKNNISSRTVTHAAPTTNPPTTNLGERTVGSKGLHVRSEPRVGDNIIGNLNQGDKVTVIEKDSKGFWCKIQYKNAPNAWVACRYLKK